MKYNYFVMVLTLVLSFIIFYLVSFKPVEAAMIDEISAETALVIATNKASISQNDIDYSNVTDSIKKGVKAYDVKIVVGHVEYIYTIDMVTGEILSSEVDL